MTDQRPLLNNKQRDNMPNSSEIIGGPEFEPAPGWGYRVNQWLKKYFNKVILPGIAVLILILGINNYVSENSDRDPFALNEVGTTGIVKYEDSKQPEATKEPVDEVVTTSTTNTALEIIQSAEPGEGITHLARKSLKKYLESNPEVSLRPEHKIYVEDYLKDKVGSQGLKVGDAVKFSTDDIQMGINAALSLNETQIQNLSKYVSLVNF